MADSVVIPQPQKQAQAAPLSFLSSFLRLIPGVLLLAAVGNAGTSSNNSSRAMAKHII